MIKRKIGKLVIITMVLILAIATSFGCAQDKAKVDDGDTQDTGSIEVQDNEPIIDETMEYIGREQNENG